MNAPQKVLMIEGDLENYKAIKHASIEGVARNRGQRPPFLKFTGPAIFFLHMRA